MPKYPTAIMIKSAGAAHQTWRSRRKAGSEAGSEDVELAEGGGEVGGTMDVMMISLLDKRRQPQWRRAGAAEEELTEAWPFPGSSAGVGSSEQPIHGL